MIISHHVSKLKVKDIEFGNGRWLEVDAQDSQGGFLSIMLFLPSDFGEITIEKETRQTCLPPQKDL